MSFAKVFVSVPAVRGAATPSAPSPVLRAATIVGLLYLFLIGVNGLGGGFKALGGGLLDVVFTTTGNPFIGLMIGILATTLVQSSSVTTSLIVGLVAAPEHALPVANAIPMIMGANIGTTVTNTVVSLAHMGRRDEFHRAFAVATCHDFFNYLAVLVLLPLELLTGYLRRTATFLGSLLTGLGGAEYESPIKGIIKAGVNVIEGAIAGVGVSGHPAAVLLIIVSAVLIFFALMMLVRTLRAAMRTRLERVVSRSFGQHAIFGILVGVVVTVMVQSSSITTSLLVPLAGAGLITLAQAFPVTIGANIGTTITAFLAALAATGPNAAAGITIALAHLLFNLSGTALIYPVPAIRRIPLGAATWLADRAVESRRWALAYVLLLFYVVPALFATLQRLLP